MIPELGNFALILALGFAILQSTSTLTRSVIYAIGQYLFLIFALGMLVISFLTYDITVIYVREHCNSTLPLLYRIGAAWGGHEGSLLLWCVILGTWTIAYIIFAPIQQPSVSRQQILNILGIINSGFIAFLFFTSNPFLRDFPHLFLPENDLTPVLQDPGLMFHPPMLYLGYIGFALCFAFAISALLQNNINSQWAKACKPWVIAPWSCLSIGIILGSWWAYRELGWGGWWFWDPVENASLLPWLSATALIHALHVCEKRQLFYGWALLLAIITFALSLIGTFLVRSGVLVSVHTFASDPTRGLILLGYLTLLIGGALVLYALRLKHIYQNTRIHWLSRETLLLINNIILLTAVSTILLGTLYPIILDSLGLEKISVGEPYFNTIFIPLMMLLLLLMGIAPYRLWGTQSLIKLKFPMIFNVLTSLAFTYSLFKFFHLSAPARTSIGVYLGIWVIVTTCHATLRKKTLNLSLAAMFFAHVGIGIMTLGIVLNKSFSEETQVAMKPGDTAMVADYACTLETINTFNRANYHSLAMHFSIRQNHHAIANIVAEQRTYDHDQTLSQTGINYNYWRDIYIALGTQLPNSAWAVRLYFKPFVRWIWFGGSLLFVSGICSLIQTARRQRTL